MELPANLEHLIRKYSTQGPRYTSYPTAVEFTSAFQRNDWVEALQTERAKNDGNYSLYFHLPFCPSLCLFCACHKVITKERDVVAPYISALEKELDSYADIVGSAPSIEQLHWGGGSPNYFNPMEMEQLWRAIVERFPNFTPDADISIELDPRTTTREQLSALVGLGFNRISLGVQDFDSTVQAAVNRIQSYGETESLVRHARELGIKSVGIDLIYGLPAQTMAGFTETLSKVVDLNPDRLALYGYAHVTWKTKVQKALVGKGLPSPEERISLFTKALTVLNQAGYDYIGMDHFARPSDGLARAVHDGTLNRNFMGYTTHRGAHLLGLGASSISSIPAAFSQNIKGVAEYQHGVSAGGFATERGLLRSAEDRLRGDLIESILCRGRISIPEFENLCGIPFFEKFASERLELNDLAADGILAQDLHEISLTPLGRLFMRNVAMIFDQYLAKHRAENRQVFSRTV